MDAACREVDGFAGGNQLLRLRVAHFARVGELRGDLRYLSSCLIVASSATAMRVHVAPFITHSNLEERRTRRRLIKRIEIANDVPVVRHMSRLAGNVAKELQRGRDFVGRRQMIDQLGQDARIGGCGLDSCRVVGILFLRRRCGLRLREHAGRACAGGRQRDGRSTGAPEQRSPAHRNAHGHSSNFTQSCKRRTPVRAGE